MTTTTYTNVKLQGTGVDASGLSQSISISNATLSVTTQPTTPVPTPYRFKSGAFGEHKAPVVSAFETGRGKALDIISVFPTRDSWAELHNTWYMGTGSIPADYKGTLSVGMPLWPDDGTVALAASGVYAPEWERFARVVGARFPTAYIRLGWEMNLPQWTHAATPANASQWKQAFRLAVQSMKKVAPRLRIVFNPNEGYGQTGTQDASLFWPGDDVVQLVGIDAYDWWPGYTDPATISVHRDGPYGWNWWLEFAKKHNKLFCLPEWGIAPANSASGGDNPTYIKFVYEWLKAGGKAIDHECYFHESGSYLKSDLFTGTNPKASAEYKSWMPRI